MVDQVLALRFGLSVLGAVFAAVLLRTPAFRSAPNANFDRGALALLIGSRLLIFVSIFLVMRRPAAGDVAGYYFPQAEAAGRGEVVYRDFHTSYGVAFPYIASLPLHLWHSPKAIVLLSYGFEAAALMVWLAASRRIFPEMTVRAAAILYITSGVSINHVALIGSNSAWLLAAAGFAFFLLITGYDFASGVLLALGLICVKLLALLFAPPMLVRSTRPVRWLVGFAVIPSLIFAAFRLFGIDVIGDLKHESQLTTSGNLPFLVRTLIPGMKPAWGGAFLAALFLVYAYVCLRARRSQQTSGSPNDLHLITLCLLAFMILSKKSSSNYLAMFLFPLCATFASEGFGGVRLVLFLLFNIAAAVEPFVDFRWFGGLDIFPFAARRILQLKMATFLMIDLAVVVGYFWLAADAHRLIFGPAATRPSRAAGSPEGTPSAAG